MQGREELNRQLAQAGLAVDAGACERLLSFLDELLRWNRRVNLTAISDRSEAIEKHLVDSLTLLPLLSGDERILDLGSGGGFPCIPLQIALPGLRVLSVDAVQKKIAFQRHAARLFGLSGFEALHVRAEELPRRDGCAAGFAVVVSRAFTALPSFAALALPCLSSGGRIIAMKGAEGERELAEAREDLAGMGLVCTELRQLRLPASGGARTLIVLQRGAER